MRVLQLIGLIIMLFKWMTLKFWYEITEENM